MDAMSEKKKRSSDTVAELKAREEGGPIASFLKMKVLELVMSLLPSVGW